MRTVQRLFRERQVQKAGRIRIAQLTLIQRRVRRHLARRENEKRGAAAGVIVAFLRECGRCSPMEMALISYGRKVKVVQKFVRGYQIITQSKLALLSLQWRKIETARLVAEYGHKADKGAGAKVRHQRS